MTQLLFINALFLAITASASAFYKYTSSYAFLNAQHRGSVTDDGVDFCVNFQEWRIRDLPSSPTEKNYTRLTWWNRIENNTDICTDNRDRFTAGDLVPADYRTWPEELKRCPFDKRDHQVNRTVDRMESKGVRNILFLVEKGKPNAYNLHNYLYSQFYNAEINDSDHSLSVFYVYKDVFQREFLPFVKSGAGQSSAELRFYQPQPQWPMDPAVVVLWLFAIGSILIGSVWAAKETRSKLEEKRPLVTTCENLGTSQMTLGMEEGQTQQQLQHQHSEQVCIVSSSSVVVVSSAVVEGAHVNVNEPPIASRQPSGLKRTHSEEIAQMNVCQHCTSVMFALVFVVVILMVAFFFRQLAVVAFNVLLMCLGTVAVHHCVYALLQRLLGGWELIVPLGLCCAYKSKQQQVETQSVMDDERDLEENGGRDGGGHQHQQQDEGSTSSPASIPFSSPPKPTLLQRPVKVISTLLFVLIFASCSVWFFYRDHYNAFYALDAINFALCIYAVKASRIRSLRLLTFLLLAMFAYDLFMVFGTRLLTPDGCSVMLQVVTGVDCQQRRSAAAAQSGKSYQPVAPIDQRDLPEKIPLLFYVPLLADPMKRCFDVEVEREYKHVMLGLGDVIIPGYLIAFCFYVDVIKRNRFYTYGFISSIGYSIGMASTFVALMMMETGQPALIYLVPCTLGPICIWALLFERKSGTLGKMWRAEL